MASQGINRENTRVGNEFEDLIVEDLRKRGALLVDAEKSSHEKKQILEETGIEIDVIATFDSHKEYIEGKGGYTTKANVKKGVGAARTDNVKKAIANAAIFKCVYPKLKFVAYFSAMPNKNSSSEQMIKVVTENKIFDEVRYVIQLEEDHKSLVDENGRFI